MSDLKQRERAAGDGSVIRGERSGAGDRVRKQGRVGALVPSKSATTAAGNRATRGTRGTTACPQCGKPLVQRVSQFGPFWGCSGYPACRYIHRDPGTAPRAASSAATPTGDNGGGDVPTKPPQQSKRPRRPPGTLTKHVVRANRERRPTSR
ncbi:MAG: topoisomerase DNA-binding C4 zinc finger domain-containing protein [Chloroflexota bacterium]